MGCRSAVVEQIGYRLKRRFPTSAVFFGPGRIGEIQFYRTSHRKFLSLKSSLGRLFLPPTHRLFGGEGFFYVALVTPRCKPAIDPRIRANSRVEPCVTEQLPNGFKAARLSVKQQLCAQMT